MIYRRTMGVVTALLTLHFVLVGNGASCVMPPGAHAHRAHAPMHEDCPPDGARAAPTTSSRVRVPPPPRPEHVPSPSSDCCPAAHSCTTLSFAAALERAAAPAHDTRPAASPRRVHLAPALAPEPPPPRV